MSISSISWSGVSLTSRIVLYVLAIKQLSMTPLLEVMQNQLIWPNNKETKNFHIQVNINSIKLFFGIKPLPHLWHYLLYCSVCTENGQLIWKVVWEGGCWRDLNRRNLGAPAHHVLVLFESMQKGQVMSHLLLNGHCTAAALVNHCDPYRLAKQLNPKDTIYCPLLYV